MTDHERNSEIKQITETLEKVFKICSSGTRTECEMAFEQLKEVYDWMDKIQDVYQIRQSWAAPKEENVPTIDIADCKENAENYEKEIQNFSVIYKEVTEVNPHLINYSMMLEKLIQIRHNKGVNRKEFSEQMGIPERSIFRFEKGITVPYISRFVSILQALDCELYIVERNKGTDESI